VNIPQFGAHTTLKALSVVGSVCLLLLAYRLIPAGGAGEAKTPPPLHTLKQSEGIHKPETDQPQSGGGANQEITSINAQLARAKIDREIDRYNQPAEAADFYRLKRLPAGATEIPVERYLAAQERMRRLPQFSTLQGRFVPSRQEMGEATEALPAWTPLGPGNIGGRTRALVIHPTSPNTIYAACVAGGVWKTTDGGVSWTPISDLIANLAVGALAMDPTNPNTLYAGTGEGYFNNGSVRGAGIFKTADGGATWARLTETNTADFHYVNDLIVSPKNNQRIYAATRTGVWRSTDGGATWTRALDPEINGGCLDLAMRTDQSGDYLFAACGIAAGTSDTIQAKVYRNANAEGDAPWSVVLTESGMGRTSLAIAPSNQNIIYAAAADSSAGPDRERLYAVFRSTVNGDSGSWTAQVRKTDSTKLNTLLFTNPLAATQLECGLNLGNNFVHQGFYDNVIAVDPADANRVWAGGVDLFRSDDGGANWGLASYWWADGRVAPRAPQYAHADHHAIVFHPQYDGAANKTMFVAGDGGVFRTDDARANVARGSSAACNPANAAVTWASLNNGYAVTQFYHGLPYPDGKTYFGGAQNNGTLRGNDADGPNQWRQINSGDGGYVAIDPTNPNILYAETTGISISKSTDGGATFNRATAGITDSGLFISPFVMDPSSPQRLWTGGSFLWRTTNAASSWIWASGIVGSGKVSAIAVAPTDANFVIAGTSEGHIHRTSEGLTSTSSTVWPGVRPRTGFVSSVAFDPKNKMIVYATYSTFGGVHVWKSVDGGATWSGIDGTATAAIPDIPVHSIVVDPNNAARLYVGTDLGVFASTDGGASWAVENTGFANVVTESLSLNNSGGVTTLFAFTHGRGAWRVTAGQGECAFAISPSDQTVGPGGGEGTVNVTATVANCAWTAASNAAWITISSGAAGSGPGAVSFTVTANATTAPRAGTVSVAGQTLIITQPGCASISPTTAVFEAAGGTGAVTITTTGGCAWTASSPVSWITIPATGSGNATINYTVAANPNPTARSATLAVAGQSLIVSQAGGGGSCAATPINPGQALNGSLIASDCSSPRRGGSSLADRYSFTGAANQMIAIWSYSSDFDTYLYLIAPDGAVIAENDDGGGRTNARLPSGAGFFTLPASGTYTVEVTSFTGSRAGNYTISLSAGSPNCSYSISSSNRSFRAAGGVGAINVTAGGGCNWQAASNASWATINSGASGAGPGVVTFTVAPNQGGTRVARLFVAGQIFTVIQSGGNLFAGGKWSSRTSGTTRDLFSVHFINNDRGWAGGSGATLLSTNDAGATWNPVNTGVATTENFHSVRFVDSSYGWVGGERVTAATYNGGTNWGRLDFTSGSRRSLFPINTISAWAVGETQGQGAHFFDLLVLSPFGGFGSGTPALTFAETLNDVYLLDDTNLWSVGNNGRIIRASKAESSNAAAFIAQPSGVTGQLNSVFMLNLDFGWVAGAGGVILRTTDGGLTWTASSSGVTANLRDLHFTDADHGWATGDGGLILSTSNGGQTWSPETTGVTANLNSLFFTPTGTGYAAGNEGVIMKRAACAYAIAPTSAQVVFGGGTGQVNVTTETGCNWTAVSNDAWLTITSGASGSGNGVIAYSAAANPNGFQRTGTIFIAGQTFTVTQAAAPIPCHTVSGIEPASGVPGSVVTITGTNLSGATAKFAGNVAATSNSSSDAQLVVTVPNGAVSGPITISKTLCLDVNTTPFTVIPVYEGDVSPRPLGNSSVTVADWTLIGHFVSGLETAQPGGEFQRADCAPRATLGDGRLTISDWVLAGRYATGLEPLTPAGGPTAPNDPPSDANVALRTNARISPAPIDQNQISRISIAQLGRSGRQLTAAITLDARGDENALSFSLIFNPSQWRLVSTVAGRDARGAALSVNDAESPGRIGLAMALPTGQSFKAGARELVILQFDAVSDAAESPFAIGFGDRPVAREIVAADSRALPANFVNHAGVANVSSALIEIRQISPSLFSANSDGQGAATAVVLRIGADGTQKFEPMVVFDLARRRFIPTPIDVSRDDEQVFLICYGTGWRGRSPKAPIKVMIGDTQVDALYVGPQGEMAGLDQLNVRLPRSLAGRGEVDLTLTVSDWQSNPVKIRIK